MSERHMKNEEVPYRSREHAVLNDFKLTFDKKAVNEPGFAYADILPQNSSRVEGILYEIEDEGIEILDRVEGFPDHYKRDKINVITDKGEEKSAIVYRASEDMVDENLKPSGEYLGYMMQGRDLLSKEYTEKLLDYIDTLIKYE